jgi:hypothetical protein
MTIASARLNLLAFPQRWEAANGKLVLRFLCLPKGNPKAPLGTGLPPFATAQLKFQAQLIGSLANAPRAADSTHTAALTLTPPPGGKPKSQVFDAVATAITINPAAPAPRGARPQYRKPATDSYRTLTGGRELNRYLVDGKGFECALNSAHETQPPSPVTITPSFRWGEVIALALRQPQLAQALGLIGEATIQPPANFYQSGGWLWVELAPGSAYYGVGATTVSHAARIPPLKNIDRSIFTAVLFPIDAANLVLDDVFREAEVYDTGYTRLVHGKQTERGSEDGDAIQLAWDDEQLAEWLNRQLDPANSFPMGTAGFRVDVRDITVAAGTWTSLQRITAPGGLKLGTPPLDLGPFTGEGTVEVVPARVSRTAATEFWMPPYFATWRGRSLVVTDADLTRLHRRNDIDWSKAPAESRLNGANPYAPLDDTVVPLKYGHKYEFRVRMADLTGGGPDLTAPFTAAPGAFQTTVVSFRRRIAPGPVTVVQRPTKTVPLKVAKPRLRYPEVLYTSAGLTFAQLETALNADIAANRAQGLGAPDPDVTSVQVTVQVRAPAGDKVQWHDLYRPFSRSFAAGQNELDIAVQFVDKPALQGFSAPAVGQPLQLPTARDVRLVLVSESAKDLTYFAEDALRKGPSVNVDLHAVAPTEADLISTAGNVAPELVSFLLRQPPSDGSVARPAERLATELGLDHHGVTLAGRAGARTVFGCSAALRHTLSPEASSITFSSESDLTQQWVHAVRFRLMRDWTWRGLAPDGLEFSRKIKYGNAAEGPWELVGTVNLPTALTPNASSGVDPSYLAAARQGTNIVFFDAHDPRPNPNAQQPGFPTEQRVTYRVHARFEGTAVSNDRDTTPVRVPAATPPAQVAKLVSAGIALQELTTGADEFTAPKASLWLEFAEPPQDPGDAYFVRTLAVAPDPTLLNFFQTNVAEQKPEPALPIDPEWVRMIRTGQSADTSGSQALQPLTVKAAQGESYLVPLPTGVDPTSPELFGMYTYEIRVGRKIGDPRWSTANGRWGPPLRVTGIKHPPPQLMCQAARTDNGIAIRAAFATPTLDGRHVRPFPPKTQLFALVYARVQQADALAWRHVLIAQTGLLPVPPGGPPPGNVIVALPEPNTPALLFGEGRILVESLEARLEGAGLRADADLAVLAVEVYTEPTLQDPLGYDLGHVPFLRTSPLVGVPDAC